MTTTSSGGEPDHTTADREIVISRAIRAARLAPTQALLAA